MKFNWKEFHKQLDMAIALYLEEKYKECKGNLKDFYHFTPSNINLMDFIEHSFIKKTKEKVMK